MIAPGHSPGRLETVLVWWGRAAVVVVLAATAVNWVGWASGVDVLTRGFASWPRMTPWTALLLGMLGIAIMALSGRPSPTRVRVGLGLAAVAGVLAAVFLAEYATGESFGLDQLLFLNTVSGLESSWPGRPSPRTGLSVFLLAFAVGLTRLDRRWVPAAWVVILLTSLTVPFLVLAAYLFQALSLVGVTQATGMGISTAVCLMLLTSAAFVSRPDRNPVAWLLARPDGLTLVRMVAVLAGPPVLIGLSRLAFLEFGLREDAAWVLSIALSTVAVGVATFYLSQQQQRLLIDKEALSRQRAEAQQQAAEAERERAQAQALYRNILEAAPEAMIIVGQDGCIMIANAETDRLFGYQRQDLIGMEVETLIPPRLRGKHTQLRKDFFSYPKARMMGTGMQLWGLRRDGTEVPVDINLSPLRAGQGLQALAAIRDVTERYQAAAQILEKNQELQRSNEDLERFAYIASHDLQEPLRHITSFVQKLEEKYGGSFDDRGLRYLGYVVDAASRMRQLIDGLLEFSRVGRVRPDLSPLDLGRVVDAAARAVSVLAQDRDARVEIGALPEVLGDEDLLFRLFVNLLANGIKFARPDRAPHVVVSAEAGEGGVVEVLVADNGIGVEEKYRDRAFEIFERLNGDKYPGTGMGLSVARRIVDEHRGSIALDATDGGGTTVRIELRTPTATGQTE
ncbi:MAG: PAS domain S-box protein [Actinomycetia bacterium]|nr:PAS domain S-box protein [Actinomycetes bacterium]MCH9700563.1 PAS domain S-box protein [Actinomycetes bacterium]MCH9760474.1 PAS domain S-box protein [Actinomycetes bacterium]